MEKGEGEKKKTAMLLSTAVKIICSSMLKALLVYFVMVYKKKKFRPGTLVYGKRGGICYCKSSDYFSNIKASSI
jgi:hypothetical protein